MLSLQRYLALVLIFVGSSVTALVFPATMHWSEPYSFTYFLVSLILPFLSGAALMSIGVRIMFPMKTGIQVSIYAFSSRDPTEVK